jgi:hypothetical protein
VYNEGQAYKLPPVSNRREVDFGPGERGLGFRMKVFRGAACYELVAVAAAGAPHLLSSQSVCLAMHNWSTLSVGSSAWCTREGHAYKQPPLSNHHLTHCKRICTKKNHLCQALVTKVRASGT